MKEDYIKNIKIHKKLFKEINDISEDCPKMLYELESIETAIATIETETMKRIIDNE